MKGGSKEPLQLRASAWIWPYYAGLAVLSYVGNYGGGLGLISDGWDMLILTVFSLVIFRLAIRLRLDSGVVDRLMESGRAELESAERAGA